MNHEEWVDSSTSYLINRIISEFLNNADKWNNIEYTSYTEAEETAWSLIVDTNSQGIWNTYWKQLAGDKTLTISSLQICDNVICALIAWPKCSYLLSNRPEQVATLAALGSNPATLMLDAIPVLSILFKEPA